MKKVFLTAIVAAAFAFGMSACNNNAPAEEVTDSAAQTEMCEHECHHHYECTCADTTCAANHCANCTDTNCCKPCDHKCCKHEGEGCQKHEGCEGKHECKHQHEGCEAKKECCEKANKQ